MLEGSGFANSSAVRYQLNAFVQKELASGRQSQDPKFRFSRFAQTGLSPLQICVVIAGMANEFPGALRNAAGDSMEQRFVERSGDENAECAVGSDESIAIYSLAKFPGEASQKTEFERREPKVPGAPSGRSTAAAGEVQRDYAERESRKPQPRAAEGGESSGTNEYVCACRCAKPRFPPPESCESVRWPRR